MVRFPPLVQCPGTDGTGCRDRALIAADETPLCRDCRTRGEGEVPEPSPQTGPVRAADLPVYGFQERAG
jgi:hypothetical protein